jgi:hypothetical protein
MTLPDLRRLICADLECQTSFRMFTRIEVRRSAQLTSGA